jgi:hypothetical protein
LPVPVVKGGNSRPLDKKWKPVPVSMPSTMAFAAAAPRVTAPMMSKIPKPPEASEAAAAAPAAPADEEAAAANVPIPAANPVAAPAANPVAEPAAPQKKKRWWQIGK